MPYTPCALIKRIDFDIDLTQEFQSINGTVDGIPCVPLAHEEHLYFAQRVILFVSWWHVSPLALYPFLSLRF